MTSILDDSKKITEKLANVNLAKKIFKGQKYEGRLHSIIKRLDLLSKNAVFLVLVSTACFVVMDKSQFVAWKDQQGDGQIFNGQKIEFWIHGRCNVITLFCYISCKGAVIIYVTQGDGRIFRFWSTENLPSPLRNSRTQILPPPQNRRTQMWTPFPPYGGIYSKWLQQLIWESSVN